MQLRYLGTLFDISNERGSTIVFPFPIELFEAFKGLTQRQGGGSSPAAQRSVRLESATMTDEARDQIEADFATAKEITQRLSESLPAFIDVAALGVRSKAPYQLLVVREALIWRTEELARNACNALEAEDFAVAAILTRAITENAALTWKLKEILDKRSGKSPEELNTALMRALAGSTTWDEAPAPYNVLSCLDALTKIIDGVRQTYESLSEVAHPNWRGVLGLYSKTDKEKFITHFGHGFGGSLAKDQITTALCAALGVSNTPTTLSPTRCRNGFQNLSHSSCHLAARRWSYKPTPSDIAIMIRKFLLMFVHSAAPNETIDRKNPR